MNERLDSVIVKLFASKVHGEPQLALGYNLCQQLIRGVIRAADWL
jgi:hypothetical protein